MPRVAAWLLVTALAMVACGSGGDSRAGVSVVASTSVWGSVAAAVGADHAQVRSIITNPAEDPHSYEVSPAEAAAITDAHVVVFNGGGYDDFVETVLADAPAGTRVDAFAVGGHQPGSNPHVFYDLPTVSAVAREIAEQLAAVDPAHASDYRANAEMFNRQIESVAAAEREIAATNAGAPMVATEDVAHYLASATGLADKTPDGFYRAVDADTDTAPADIATMLDLVQSRGMRVVLFNPQTATPVTRRIVDAAGAASVPVVEVGETLPDGTDFVAWQRQILDQLNVALS